MFFLALMVIGTGSAWGALTNLTVGGEGQFHKWTSVEDNSTVVKDGDATCGEIHLNTDLNGYGALVYGTSSVWALHYAKLTGQKCIYIEGSDNLELRFLFNRSTDTSNDYVEKIVKITNGSATLDLTQFESTYCHLNVIKVQSGSGQVTKLQVSDTYITSYNLNYSAAPSMASAYTNEAYSLPGASRNGMVLTGWFDAATGGTLIGYPIPEGSSNKNYTPISSRVLYAHWANAESTEQIGDTEKKIEARRSFSPAKEIAYGKQQTFTFVNHAGGNMWNNWMLCLTSENKAKDYVYTNLDITRYITTSSDGIYKHQESSKVYLKTVGGLEEVNTSDEKNTFLSDMQNANVTVNVNFSTAKDIIYIYATMVGNGKTYLYQYRFAMPSDLRPESIWASFTVDGAYLTDFDASAAPKQVYNVGTNLNGESANGGTVTITNADGMIITNQFGVTIPAAVGETYTWTCTGSGNVGFSDWGNNNYSNPRNITVDSGDKTPYAKFIEGYSVTFSPNYSGRGTVKAKVNGVEIVSGTYVPSGTEVTFTATANSGYKTWKWEIDGSDYYNTEQTITITKNTNATYNFTQGITYNAYANDGTYGSVTVTDGSQNGNTIVVNPWSGNVTFKATPKGGATLEGWYTDLNCTTPVVAIPDKIVIDGNNVQYLNGYITADGSTINLWAKFNAPPAFDPALDLNSTTHGSNATISNGVLTATGGIDNWVKVKDLTGQGKNYSGIRVTTQGKACRIIVRYGEADATQKETYVDAAEKATTSYYSWSMLDVPEDEVANLTSIRFAGASSDFGVTTFSNASLVSVEETTPYTREVGALREFNLNDTRVQLYGHESHYQMGGNIEWVYKEETSGNKFVTMKTTGTSWNQMEIFNSGHGMPNYDGVRIDYKGKHFRVIAYTGDGQDDKFVATAPNADNRTARYITWSEFLRGGDIMTENDIRNIKRIDVAGCSEHDAEEAVNFYSIRLHKKSTDVIYTDESTTVGKYADGVLTFTENQDGKDVSVAFSGINGGDRHEQAGGCNGTIIKRGEGDSFTVSAPECYKVTKVIVGLGENTTGKANFNSAEDVAISDKNQITWTNTTDTKTVTMTFASGASNEDFHITYVYYELEEIAIPSIDVNGKKREYATYVPDGISGEVGVIISLHGASNDYYNGRVDFNAIADAKKDTEGKKFIVVYPRGLMRQLRGTERGWETYTESNTEDVEFFKAIVTELKKTYSVDMSRIYLAGFSNGGMMAYKAAHQAGDFFAAFASVGGFPVNESHLFHAGSQPTPFIHIQGAADVEFSSTKYDLSTIAHNMTYRNGAHFNPYDTQNNSDGGVVPEHSNVTREIHIADEGGAAYFLYKIAGMGHTWFYNWDGNAGDDVATAIWNFFDYSDKVNNIDKTLKFRMDDPNELWSIASTGKSSKNVEVGYIGFDKVNQTVDGIHYVLSYGGRTKTDNGTTFNKDSNNKNLWHSLQFNGGINGAPHFLKLNVETKVEETNDFFLVKLTKTGDSKPVFAKRYQAGRGKKDLYINFAALPGFNEYKLEVTKSRSDLTVMVHGMEFYSGKCSDKDQEENPVFYTDIKTIVSGLKPIYQPVFGTTFDGLAKEYLPIANIPIGEIEETHVATGTTRHYKVIEDDLKVNEVSPTGGKLPSQWGATTTSTTVTGTGYKNLYVSNHSDEKDPSTRKVNNIAYILGSNNYTVDPVKGLNISQHGRAQMVEYLNGTVGNFPTKGMLAIKFEGTCDFTLLAENDIPYTDNVNNGRSTLKVYYTNDQLDGELKELMEWRFYGTRSEGGGNDNINKGPKGNETGNSLEVLTANIRLQQLGKDGTCTVFITYEGRGQHEGPFTHESGDNDKIWIKGFVIKRPDLKVTIGRTDSKYAGQNRGGEENTKLTRFGENKPYIWSFENVGFNNTRRRKVNGKLEDDTQETKVNVNDWRTYVCGGTDDSFDHLLVYSDVNSDSEDGKVHFDGRVAGQEHIEFRQPSQYLMKDNPADDSNGRLEFNPITSNGLKVNVTGSGWFKIKCSAPNGKVKMKVFSSTNYGISYTNLLREFVVDNSKHPTSATGKEDHRWGEYTVYLKGHVEREWAADKDKKLDGFWDGDKNKFSEDDAANAEEKVRMSLYVVFDKIDGVDYKEDRTGPATTAQLNIHQLSWLNEEPADYVFQREEDPKLLTTWQAIRRDGDGNKTLDDRSDANVVLYWMAGTDKKEKHDGTFIDTYNRLGQMTTNISGSKGVKSPGGYASTSVPSDAGTYDAYWDIAAPALTNAHTEKAYANQGYDYQSSTEYTYTNANGGNTEFDMPISGSFIRICAMKNTYVVAHVLPGATNGAVYVLDETGSPIPFVLSGEPLSDAKRLGYITSLSNIGEDKEGGKTTSDGTIRIDFKANAGKEYFICAKDASISLARLEIHDWRHKPAKASDKLMVADNTTNNSTIIDNAYDDAVANDTYYRDASLKRTFAAEKWASLVLPFSLNEKKFEKIFGENAKVLHFTDFDGNTCTLKFTRHFYNIIVAGRPVFVWPTKEVTNPDFNDITLQTNTVRNTVTPSGFSFVGSYDNADILRNDLYMNNNNVIKYINTNSKYPGMRSFIKNNGHYDFFTETPVAAGVKAVLLSFDDDEPDMPTGIEELVSAEFGEDVVVVTKTTKIYDLLGNVIGEGSDIKNLPTGVYIVNGKKYYVK